MVKVVIVGAGIIGAAIGAELGRHGVSDVLVVDKALGIGEGSTGASSSISRCRYTHNEVVRLALQGQDAFRHWPEFTSLERPRAKLEDVGVVWLMGETSEKTEADADRLRGQGAAAESLGPEELRSLFPVLSTCGAPVDTTGVTDHMCVPGEAFLYEPGGGYVDPVAANADLIDSSLGRGVEVRFGTAVTSVRRSGGRVTGVGLNDGSSVSADLVINAAGPWCNQINEMAGFDHRWTLTPTRIQTVYRPWPSGLRRLPVGADSSTGIYFRPDSGGRQVLVGSVRPEHEEELVADPDDFRRTPDAAFTELMLASLHHRVPQLEPRGLASGVAGLYTINREDVHPIIGPTDVEGFWVANGFSGHGFKLAPAIGSMVAQAYSGEKRDLDSDVDPGFFAFDRAPIDVGVKHVLA